MLQWPLMFVLFFTVNKVPHPTHTTPWERLNKGKPLRSGDSSLYDAVLASIKQDGIGKAPTHWELAGSFWAYDHTGGVTWLAYEAETQWCGLLLPGKSNRDML